MPDHRKTDGTFSTAAVRHTRGCQHEQLLLLPVVEWPGGYPAWRCIDCRAPWVTGCKHPHQNRMGSTSWSCVDCSRMLWAVQPPAAA
jgi:hypothetical protein